jgi:hypothetical protein
MENNTEFKNGDIVIATNVYQELGEMEVAMVEGEFMHCQFLDEKKQVQLVRIFYKNLEKVSRGENKDKVV